MPWFFDATAVYLSTSYRFDQVHRNNYRYDEHISKTKNPTVGTGLTYR